MQISSVKETLRFKVSCWNRDSRSSKGKMASWFGDVLGPSKVPGLFESLLSQALTSCMLLLMGAASQLTSPSRSVSCTLHGWLLTSPNATQVFFFPFILKRRVAVLKTGFIVNLLFLVFWGGFSCSPDWPQIYEWPSWQDLPGCGVLGTSCFL